MLRALSQTAADQESPVGETASPEAEEELSQQPCPGLCLS